MGEVHDYGYSTKEIISDLQSKIELLKKEKAHHAEMNKRYLGKMKEQQDMIANAKNIIEKHDPFIPTLTVLALEKALRGECE